jgi:choline-phosphate cytidylyltransferase
MSVHATASTTSSASAASPRAAPPPNLPIHAAITSANLFPGQPFRRGARRVDELSGEGSQSEGLDSPT